MSAGFTAHTHDVLEAVETGAPRVVDGLAVVCTEDLVNLQRAKSAELMM